MCLSSKRARHSPVFDSTFHQRVEDGNVFVQQKSETFPSPWQYIPPKSGRWKCVCPAKESLESFVSRLLERVNILSPPRNLWAELKGVISPKLRGIVGKTSTEKSFWVELCQSLMAIKLSVWRNISTNYEWNFPAQSPADAKTVTRPNNLSNWSNSGTFSVGINICCWCSEIK